MITPDMNQWLAKLGVNPQVLAGAGAGAGGGAAGAAKNAAVAPDPWASAANPAAAAGGAGAAIAAAGASAAGGFPQPMQADCAVVHGKVPGPKNHLLCSKHGHVVDVDTKTIIARDVSDYQKRGLGGKAGAAGGAGAAVKAAAASLGAGPAKAGAAAGATGDLPQPMQPDCAIVHGKVPGPKNHVLCGKHGHILDINTKTIIAHDLGDYQKRQVVGKAVAATAPVVQKVVNAAESIPILGNVISAATGKSAPPASNGGISPPVAQGDGKPATTSAGATPATTTPAGAQPGKQDEQNRGTVKSLIELYGRDYIKEQYLTLDKAIQEFVMEQQNKIASIPDPPTKSGGLLGALASAATGVLMVICAPEMEAIEGAKEIVEIINIGKETASKADEAAEKEAEGDEKADVAEMRRRALKQLEQFSKAKSRAIDKANEKMKGTIAAAIAKLDANPAQLDALMGRNLQDNIKSIVTDTLGIRRGEDKDPTAPLKLKHELNNAMASWLKKDYVEHHMVEKGGGMVGNVMAAQMKAIYANDPDAKADREQDLREEYDEKHQKEDHEEAVEEEADAAAAGYRERSFLVGGGYEKIDDDKNKAEKK